MKDGIAHKTSTMCCSLEYFIHPIQAQNLCPSSHRGGSDVPVHYPFKFEHEPPPSSNCTYFNLTCNEAESAVVVNLPSAGDFHVQKIDYAGKRIQLYDPGNCLIRRILGLDLDSSPFMADLDNFTFYTCPLDADVDVDPVSCLSNATNIAIAVRESFKYDHGHGCQPANSGMLPVDHDDTFFFLKWDSHYCVDCKESGWRTKLVTKLIAIALTLPGFIIMAVSFCSVYVMKMIRDKYAAAAEAAAPPAPPPSAVGGGVDESKILGCTELVVIRELRNEGWGGGNSKTCSICLENYSEKETVSVISRCGHSFHAACIRHWLLKNATCPVCRTSLPHDVV